MTTISEGSIESDSGVQVIEEPRYVMSRRAVMGVVLPSTNTVIEPDFGQLCPPGVTLHYARALVPGDIAIDVDNGDESFSGFVQTIISQTDVAVRDVLTCHPDHLPLGWSIPTFWGGAEGAEAFRATFADASGLEVSVGSLAIVEALRLYEARRIAFICPYFPVGARHIEQFFTDHDIDVRRWEAFSCPTPHSMARVSEQSTARALARVDGPDVDALVQLGGNLAAVAVVDAAERWLGKPVIAINPAIMWHALRAVGINDRFEGSGSLLRDW